MYILLYSKVIYYLKQLVVFHFAKLFFLVDFPQAIYYNTKHR